MRLIILGPPGSGKGTQSELLSKKLGVPTISVGHLLREEVEKETDFGKEAYEYMAKGDWVPHEITFQILKKRLEKDDVSKGFILDAFPRLSVEYHQLGIYLSEKGWDLDAVINLQVSDIECLRRIKVRADIQESKGVYRPDNDDLTILNRLKNHHNTSSGILEYYKDAELLIPINGNDSVNVVHNNIMTNLEKISLK